MNYEVIWCVITLIVLCMIGAIGTSVWLNSFDEYVPFLNTKTFEETKPGFEAFLIFWTFVIILQVIIPLSLYVTIEMAKLLQIYLIQQDLKMYDETCDRRVECRALNIPEELGQVICRIATTNSIL
jgi:phospholipid-translocating ATPase